MYKANLIRCMFIKSVSKHLSNINVQFKMYFLINTLKKQNSLFVLEDFYVLQGNNTKIVHSIHMKSLYLL